MKRLLARRMLQAAVSSTSEGHRHVIIRNNASILALATTKGEEQSSQLLPSLRTVKRNSLPAETVNQQHTQHHQHDTTFLQRNKCQRPGRRLKTRRKTRRSKTRMKMRTTRRKSRGAKRRQSHNATSIGS